MEMHSQNDSFSEFHKGRLYVNIAMVYFILLPLLIIIFIFNIVNKLDIPSPLIFLLTVIISSIPFNIFYIYSQNKKESRRNLELGDMEDKIVRKNLRKWLSNSKLVKFNLLLNG